MVARFVCWPAFGIDVNDRWQLCWLTRVEFIIAGPIIVSILTCNQRRLIVLLFSMANSAFNWTESRAKHSWWYQLNYFLLYLSK